MSIEHGTLEKSRPWLFGSGVTQFAPDARDPRFESQHRQSFIYQLNIKMEEMKIDEKYVGKGPPSKK